MRLLDRIIVLAFFPVVASNQIYPLSGCKYIKKMKSADLLFAFAIHVMMS